MMFFGMTRILLRQLWNALNGLILSFLSSCIGISLNPAFVQPYIPSQPTSSPLGTSARHRPRGPRADPILRRCWLLQPRLLMSWTFWTSWACHASRYITAVNATLRSSTSTRFHPARFVITALFCPHLRLQYLLSLMAVLEWFFLVAPPVKLRVLYYSLYTLKSCIMPL